MSDTQPSPPAGLTTGRIVHFVLPEGYRRQGEHRPAIVVKVWELLMTPFLVQLVVFLDGSNDSPAALTTKWVTSVPFDASGEKPGSWHWIERA